MLHFLLLFLLGFASTIQAQDNNSTAEQILILEKEKTALEKKQTQLYTDLEKLRLLKIREDLKKFGLPTHAANDPIIEHSALILGYSEEDEQARWVSHIVIPEVSKGNLTRTNDFRVDPKITTGSSEKDDYWYSGYDRGHLAPSADFRWSRTAISESYFYSNMSPQRPELNRESWAALESWVRKHVHATGEQMVVISGGVLKPGLKKLGKNEVSIPTHFYKVILDMEGDEHKAIAFLMPNGECNKPVLSYAVSVDKIEEMTGMDFFSKVEDGEENKLEASFNTDLWDSNIDGQIPDQAPLEVNQRPKNTINSIEAEFFVGQKATVCGMVVSAKKTQKGHVFLNLDSKFPNHVFSVAIWGQDVKNFSYDPDVELLGKRVCITGKITDNKGKPSMNITHEKKIKFLDEEMAKKKKKK